MLCINSAADFPWPRCGISCSKVHCRLRVSCDFAADIPMLPLHKDNTEISTACCCVSGCCSSHSSRPAKFLKAVTAGFNYGSISISIPHNFPRQWPRDLCCRSLQALLLLNGTMPDRRAVRMTFLPEPFSTSLNTRA